MIGKNLKQTISTKNVITGPLEDQNIKLHNNNVASAVLTDLSKGLNCIPHDLLVAKLDTYGFNRETNQHLLTFKKHETLHHKKIIAKVTLEHSVQPGTKSVTCLVNQKQFKNHNSDKGQTWHD